MPKLLYSFRCEEGHVTDHFIDTSIKKVTCECGKEAKRLLSTPHFPLSQGVDESMPTAALRWEKMQRGKATGKIKDSNNDRFGGPRPQDE